jgi:uroporphyrinogen-III synthase
MSQTSPLLGKRILVPRGKKEAKSFSALVEAYGGVPLEIPLLAFRPITTSDRILDIVAHIDTYDWIIFTSNVTVETFLSYFKSTSPELPQIAVIGNRTADILEKKGYGVKFIPNEFVAEGFVRDFSPHITKDIKVLIPKGNLARDYIAESLREYGAIVDEIVVYETHLPQDSKNKLIDVISQNQLDILTFTSPSTVDHFMEVIDENELHGKIDKCLIACIGPVTKERIESVGLRVDVIPEIYTVDHMLKEIILYLQRAH